MPEETGLEYVAFEVRNARSIADGAGPEVLETDTGDDRTRGVAYQFDEGLKLAVGAAMTLGRPLLVTGEPGSGKSELGYAIARNLPDRPFVRHFVCRSASVVKDLFYVYDSLARFHQAQIGALAGASGSKKISAEPFIRYTALGRAVLDAWGVKDVTELTASTRRSNGVRSVVIIDEIDKATRDFCNDLLDQLETLSFEVPELARESRAYRTPGIEALPRRLRPIVIIASNSEKLLPEPFLRRCLYYPIASPDRAMLEIILQERLLREFGEIDDRAAGVVNRVRRMFDELRQMSLIKPPGTAELIDAAVIAVAYVLRFKIAPSDLEALILPALVKDLTDIDAVRRHPFSGASIR